jgi:hypothetical protein
MKYVKLFEAFVNEAKINVKDEVKRLKSMGYKKAKVSGAGIVVDGIDAPNSNYNGKVTMSWDPKEGIYSDDDRYSGNDHSYNKFLDILENPESTEGKWGGDSDSDSDSKLTKSRDDHRRELRLELEWRYEYYSENSDVFADHFHKFIDDSVEGALGTIFREENPDVKLSTENIAYILENSWAEMCRRNDEIWNGYASALENAFKKFKVKTEVKYTKAVEKGGYRYDLNLKAKGEQFAKEAYIGYEMDIHSMAEGFGVILADFKIVTPAVWKKMEKYLVK